MVWLDSDRRYTGLVDQLVAARAAGALPYEVRGFRGSFLALMLELAPLSSGIDKELLVVHLPGFHKGTIKDTPILELYRAGVSFERALDTLVNEAAAGRVPPERVAKFLARPERAGALSLDVADAWLAEQLQAPEGGVATLIAAMSPQALIDDLLHQRGVFDRLEGDLTPLAAYFARALGVPRAWQEDALRGNTPDNAVPGTPRDVAHVAASWAMAVEYVHDLSHPPSTERLAPATGLPAAVVTACRELAVHLRAGHGDFYEQTARQTQDLLLGAEVAAARAADLGKIDTFPFEDEVVLDEALEALRDAKWSVADAWARQRIDGQPVRPEGSGAPAGRAIVSFWLERRPSRKSEWQLVGAAARLGLAIETAGSGLGPRSKVPGIDAAAERYVSHGAAVDQAHRHLEQLRHALLYAQLERFEELRPLLDEMREHWRTWADGWARDFSQRCRTDGFLPDASLQQRTLFDEVVRPLASKGTTAFFMVDALRFEMGQELHRIIADTPATEARLDHRLAELPSNTEVGMNVLAPVARDGRLTPALRNGRIAGFSAGEFRVSNPETRQRAMKDRVGGSTCPWLSLQEVIDRGATSLKAAVARARLVVVHSEEIDKAGERDLGPRVFDQVLRQLRTAWRLLRDAGVKHFVFSADHGFLLLHDRARNAQTHGRKIDPHRRHVLSTDGADRPGEVRVPLGQLGYDLGDGEAEDVHLICPETTAAFDVGERGSGFVHGGNSLQERVIPVLTVVHRAAAGASSLRYRVVARHEPSIAGMHSMALTVEVAAQSALAFARDKEVELALRARDLGNVDLVLIQARRGGRIDGDSFFAPVGQEIDVFFRLHGRTDARAQVEVFHPAAAVEVEAFTIPQRFEVAADGSKPDEAETRPAASGSEAGETGANDEATAAVTSPAPAESGGKPAASERAAPRTEAIAIGDAWLEDLPASGVRQLFAHLSEHGTVSEAEAMQMFGGARKLRRFSARFEDHAARAPFSVRIEVVAGVKTYVREGSR